MHIDLNIFMKYSITASPGFNDWRGSRARRTGLVSSSPILPVAEREKGLFEGNCLETDLYESSSFCSSCLIWGSPPSQPPSSTEPQPVRRKQAVGVYPEPCHTVVQKHLSIVSVLVLILEVDVRKQNVLSHSP